METERRQDDSFEVFKWLVQKRKGQLFLQVSGG